MCKNLYGMEWNGMEWNGNLCSIRSWLSVKEHRFKLAQILFILSVTFGLFLSDTSRKILIIVAFLCLYKTDVKRKFFDFWSRDQKILAAVWIVLFAWLFLIPLFLGYDPILERIRSTAWLIELTVFIFGTLIFAKDRFFLNNLKKCAIVSCVAYAIFALSHRIYLNFNIGVFVWPIINGSWAVGTIFSALMPWLIYTALVEKLTNIKIFFMLILTSIVMVLTMYTTFWLVLFIELNLAVFIIFIFFRSNLKNILPVLSAFLIVLCFSTYLIAISYPLVYKKFVSEFAQLSLYNFEMERFTNQRYHIWQEAIEYIRMRPIFGYGWADFGNFSFEQRIHTHCSFLQAAWTGGWIAMLLLIIVLICLIYNCICMMVRERRFMLVPFIVLLVVSAYIATGLFDDLFRASRRNVTLYWVTFALMLTPLASYTEPKMNREKNE